MWSRRFLLVLLLSVSVDLGATVLPTTHGVVWDDEEEAVHVRRESPGARRVEDRRPATAAIHALPSPVRSDAAALRPDRRIDRSEPRRDLGAARPDPAAPSEDH